MKYSYRRKQILLLLLEDKSQKRSLGYIARKIGMLYPNIHKLINQMESRDKLVRTLKQNSNGTRIIELTDKGKILSMELMKE